MIRGKGAFVSSSLAVDFPSPPWAETGRRWDFTVRMQELKSKATLGIQTVPGD